MIIDCICGLKKFEVSSDQIPSEGRQVKCGVCSKEWFYKPEGMVAEQPDEAIDTNEQENQDSIISSDISIPPETEEAISAAEQDQKINLDFNDYEDNLPSKAEMDANLEKFKASRKKKKTSMPSATRTRFLVYLLIFLLLALTVVSVPYKDTILAIFPELGIVFEGLTPVYEAIFK